MEKLSWWNKMFPLQNMGDSTSTTVLEHLVPARRTSRFLLNHNSVSKTLWDWLILLASIYVVVTLPYNLSFVSSHDLLHAGQDTIICDIVVEIIFVIDHVIREPRSIGMRYATTWFFVDLVAAFPFHLLYALNVPMTPLIHMMKMVRLLRLLRLVQKLHIYNQSGHVTLVLLLSSFTLVAHWMACICNWRQGARCQWDLGNRMALYPWRTTGYSVH